MLKQLPKGWRWIKLRDVCIKITDGTHKTPKYTSEGVRFISIENIKPFKIDFTSYVRFISPAEHKELTKRCKPEKGDILVTKIGTLGIASMINFDEEISIFVGLALLKPKKEIILPKYLEIIMNSPQIRELSYQRARGAGRKTLPLMELKNFLIPLPPLDTQRKIIIKFEEVFLKIEKARKLREEALKDTEQIMQSALNEVFSKAEEKGWKLVKLGNENLFHIETGATPKTNVKEYWENGNIKWVTPKDLGKITTSKFIFDTERKITKEGLKSCSTTIIPKDSIIISTRAPIGHIAVTGDKMCFNQGCKGIIIKDRDRVSNDFLYYVLLTKVEEMNVLGSGATFKEISRKKLASIKIPLPPIEEQKRIAEYFDRLYEKVISLKKHQEETQKEIEMLTASVLNKAFTGELS